ncbi:MAG: hypothetical protein MAG795_00786 [Candidatus Woesearchaeota archaeon]|nr:hypothetical protein [Candidatus Woesearchaeota archaeon]
MHRVQKLLSRYGYCSRRKGEELIKKGRVRVNDRVIKIGDKASKKDKIYVDNKLVKKQKLRYIMFNKPVGCVTSLKSAYNETIMKYIDVKQRVFPVGRLDYETSGLLILTNDGDFANRIMHPRYEVDKTYLLELKKQISKKQILQLEKGVDVGDYTTHPAKVKKINDKSMELTIHEGKKRIVRKMLKALGNRVVFLKRVGIGKLRLGKLRAGEYVELTEREKELIYEV